MFLILKDFQDFKDFFGMHFVLFPPTSANICQSLTTFLRRKSCVWPRIMFFLRTSTTRTHQLLMWLSCCLKLWTRISMTVRRQVSLQKAGACIPIEFGWKTEKIGPQWLNRYGHMILHFWFRCVCWPFWFEWLFFAIQHPESKFGSVDVGDSMFIIFLGSRTGWWWHSQWPHRFVIHELALNSKSHCWSQEDHLGCACCASGWPGGSCTEGNFSAASLKECMQ